MPEKIDFRPKITLRDDEGHNIIIKGSIQQEYLSNVNTYAHNIGAVKCIN